MQTLLEKLTDKVPELVVMLILVAAFLREIRAERRSRSEQHDQFLATMRAIHGECEETGKAGTEAIRENTRAWGRVEPIVQRYEHLQSQQKPA